MKKVKIQYFIVLLLAMFILPFHVSASNGVILHANKKDLKAGEELIITADLSEAMESYALVATLKYDEKVFEKISGTSFESKEGLVDVTYNSQNNKFGIINKSGSPEENLFTIHLKVREDANVGDTNIALTNISSSNGDVVENLAVASLKVYVTRDAKEGEVLPNYKENDIVEDDAEEIKAFTTKPIIIGLGCAALLFLGAILYFRIKLKDKKTPVYALAVLEVLIAGAIISLLVVNNNKKDVNNDGTKDYDDAQEIIQYLLDINSEKDKTDDNLFDKDVNNDGKVDVSDVGYVTNKVTQKTKVTLKEDFSANYVPKGKMTLSFKATITPKNVKIKKVKIGNQYYDVKLSNGVYTVTIDTPSKAGKYDFTIASVILDNKKEIKTKLVFKREILKDIPTIHMLDVNEEDNKLTFKLKDDENALIEGSVTVYDANNQSLQTVELKDDNTIEYPFEEGKLYYLVATASYDLDSDRENNENLYTDQEIFTHTFKVYKDYNFKLTDVSITDSIQKDEKPVVSFVSTNNKAAKIEVVTLNNEDYNVTKIDGNNYSIELSNADVTPGKHTVTLDSVELSTLKLFENNKDYKTDVLTYYVLKTKPTVTNINLTANEKTKTIRANFELVDNDLTLTSLKAVLLDSTGKIVDSKSLTMEEIVFNKYVELSYNKNLDGLYTVEFLADYAIGDKYKYTSTDIGKKDIAILDDIYIKNITIKSPNTKYPTKGQKKYEVIFDVYVGNSVQEHFTQAKGFDKPQTYSRLAAVTINGLNYVAEGQTSPEANVYRSRVSLTIPDESGIVNLLANRVQMQYASYYIKHEDYYSVPSKEMQIEVLKDVPKISNLKVVDDYENRSATFDFDVVLDDKAKQGDESFKAGTIELNGSKISIDRGHNQVKFFEITPDQTFDLIFKASYDLDTDTILEDTDQNEINDKEIHRVKYGLFADDNYANVAITDSKVISADNYEYFAKDEKIKLQFKITGLPENLSLNPQRVLIDGKEYQLSLNEDTYEVILDGYQSSGRKNLTLTDVIFDNGKQVLLALPVTFNPEVLKDPITIADYKYEVLANGDIRLTFDTKDTDRSLVDNARIKIVDENGQSIFDGYYVDEVTFAAQEDVLRYYVTINADYDRDIDKTVGSANYYANVKLFEEVISLDENNIELKDITEVNLYRSIVTSSKEETILVDEITKKELNRDLDSYFVQINMEHLPSVRARIINVVEENNHLILVLDYKYVTKENSNKAKNVRIDYGEIRDGVAHNESHPDIAAQTLYEKLKNNEDVTLTQNYDFSYAKGDNLAYIENYSGKLDGNGHTIKNLNRPLFGTITGEVKNLSIVNVTLNASGHGALANKADKAVITNVLVDKVTRNQSDDSHRTGGLVGEASGAKISSCRATNVLLKLGWLSQQNGLLVGNSHSNTEVTNCYAEGTLSGGWSYTSGFIGNAQSTTMKNNYVKVTATGQTEGSTAFANAYNDRNSVYTNNIALTTGVNGGFAGNAKELNNNYLFVSDGTRDSIDGVTTISKNQINEQLFKETMHFDEKIWRFKNVSYDNLPILQIEYESSLNDISNQEYREENETLYSNLTKLMPFYDSDKIIESAKNITDTNLKTKEIMHIIPVDKNGDIVSYLTSDNVRRISKIKVVYKTKEKAEYSVIYDKTYDMVVSYRIPSLKIDYNYNHYVIDANSQVVNNLTNYLKSLNYTNNLDILTASDDSRIYRDFYNDVTSKELKEFVLKFLSNSNYTNSTNDEGINNYIEREVKKDKHIEKVLYMYNYFKRWYSLDIDGMDLSDFMLFGMQGFDSSLTPIEITNQFFKDDSNFNTAETNTKYASVLGGYTKLNTLAKFLEYMVKEFSDETDMSRWVRSQFKGYLVEIPVKGHPEVQYTLWDHFSHEDAAYHNPYKVYNFILPILTLPKNAAYIVSSPVQFVIGAQRTYIVDPEDPTDHATLVYKIKTRTDRMTNYYATAYGILEDANLFNNIHTFHTDKRYTYDENGIQTYQQKGSTEEPFHKNFNEVVGQWAHSDGNNAVSWGDRIDWSVAGFLDSDLKTDGTPDPGHTTYNTWSHESAHNIDARLFLRNNGRRYDGHGEDYADSNLTQGFNKNDIVMNLSVNFNNDQLVGSNLRPDRINSQSKIWSFYKGVFDSVYVMDYLEALAFLKLDPKDQATVAVQVSYPDEEKYVNGAAKEKYLGRRSSKYKELTAKDFENMHLETIDDLIKNKIMIQPGIYKEASRGVSLYGGEGLNVVHWYQPYNPYGRPDSYSLKWLAYEMMGYKGYDNGYIEYYSNIHPTTLEDIKNYKTDNMAIAKISGNKYSNIDEYKKARFEEVKANLDKLNSKVNVQYYVQKFYDELKRDAEFERASLEKLFSNQTEEQCLAYYWCVHGDLAKAIAIPYSSEVRYEIYYTLKSTTNEFTSSIYEKNHVQDVDNIVINEKEA